MDSEHAQKLDGLVDGWREVEKARQRASSPRSTAAAARRGTHGLSDADASPTGNGRTKHNCDQLSPVHDQMIALIKLAFEWDLTRVVAFTLSGASSGQRWPSQGVDQAHHTLEHSNNVAGLEHHGHASTPRSSPGCSTALKGIDDGNGKTALYNSSVMLGMECWSDSSSGHYLDEHPVHPRRAGRGQVPDRPHRRRGRAQQQRSADLDPERLGHRLERVRPGEPVQGADRLTVRSRS